MELRKNENKLKWGSIVCIQMSPKATIALYSFHMKLKIEFKHFYLNSSKPK